MLINKFPKHILVIRLSAMGDVAMTVPVLRVVTTTYPEVKITVLSKPFFKPLFHDIPNVSFLQADVYGKHKGVFGIIKLAKEARKLKINTVADLHNVLRSKILGTYLSFTGIKTRKIDKGRSEKKALIEANGVAISQLKTTHERYAEVFAKLGFPIDLQVHTFPKRKQLLPKHHEIIGLQPKKLIGIAPFAAHKGKMYPLNYMQDVIHQLDETGRFKIFLFGGGAKEAKKLDKIAKNSEDITNCVGLFSFEEELTLIANLDVMLSMDSGNGHLAAMYGIPVITLWGVTHPYAGFVPFNQPNKHQLITNRAQYPKVPTSIYGNKYPKDYEDCMKSISSALVVEKVLEIL